MNSKAQHLIDSSRTWLTHSVFPLWNKEGIDPDNGGFEESLTNQGKPTRAPRRAMVQCRQIFSYAEAIKLEVLPRSQVEVILKNSTEFLTKYYQLPSGAFRHAVHPDGSAESPQSELYTQAFALFGLARSYSVLKNSESKTRAKSLLHYLQTERRGPYGGYTEIKNNQLLFQSNPHMHLFEAALAWAAVDSDLEWIELCQELYTLCKRSFVDATSGALCEHFDEKWQPLRENGRFFFEPGHHYEWAWLLVQFEKITKTPTGDLPTRLFALADHAGLQSRPWAQIQRQIGVSKDSPIAAETSARFAIDEVWNDLTPKKTSSRFWPQTERVKAAIELGLRNKSEQAQYAACADEAMLALWAYLDSPLKGTWQDTLSEKSEFVPLAPKASSLYHIILAISEYVLKRPQLASANGAK